MFRDREFGALFIADASSRIGSQLGKFALAALVYERTRSAGLAAVTFATTYLPGLLGGPILSTLADRLPRRSLLIGCDLTRAGLMCAIALLDMPIGAALGLLLVVELVRVPFGAARMAILADILEGERFAVGNALVGASQQAVQVIGVGVGGFVIIGLGAQGALLADTVSYGFSALLIILFIRRRPAPHGKDTKIRLWQDTLEGVRIVGRTGRLPTLFWLLFFGPTVLGTAEGLAVPYAYSLGGGERLAGLFLAATPLGAVLGLTWVGKMTARRREGVLIPFSLTVGLCVAAAGLVALPVVVVTALFFAGIVMGHVAHLQASIIGLIEPQFRGRIIGLANTVLQLGQAAAILLAGFVAEALSIRGVLVYAGVGATIGVFIVSIAGAPYAGKHRADPRALRRERKEHKVAELASAHGARHSEHAPEVADVDFFRTAKSDPDALLPAPAPGLVRSAHPGENAVTPPAHANGNASPHSGHPSENVPAGRPDERAPMPTGRPDERAPAPGRRIAPGRSVDAPGYAAYSGQRNAGDLHERDAHPINGTGFPAGPETGRGPINGHRPGIDPEGRNPADKNPADKNPADKNPAGQNPVNGSDRGAVPHGYSKGPYRYPEGRRRADMPAH